MGFKDNVCVNTDTVTLPFVLENISDIVNIGNSQKKNNVKTIFNAKQVNPLSDSIFRRESDAIISKLNNQHKSETYKQLNRNYNKENITKEDQQINKLQRDVEYLGKITGKIQKLKLNKYYV